MAPFSQNQILMSPGHTNFIAWQTKIKYIKLDFKTVKSKVGENVKQKQ